MNFTLKQLAYLVAAAEKRSITQAADAQNISQSAVSAAIKFLEAEFGVELIIRHPSKGLTLTRAGTNVVNQARKLLESAEEFRGSVANLATILSGELHVGCFAPVAPFVLPPIIQSMVSQYPDISVHLFEGDLEEVQHLLSQGIVDVAVTYDLGLSESFHYEKLVNVPPHVILAESDPLVEHQMIEIEQIVDKPMILLDLPVSRIYFPMLFEARGYAPRILHRSKSYEMVRSLVASGLGYSLLNLRPAIDQTYNGSTVVCRPLKDPVRPLRFVLAYPTTGQKSRIVEHFADTCKLHFQSGQTAPFFVE